ncbi:MAG TPA: galactosyltransferase-related protein [Polyangiaceae bacterium]
MSGNDNHEMCTQRLRKEHTKPNLWVVTACMGRLSFLQQSAPGFLSHPSTHLCVVDYSCPDHCGDYIASTFATETNVGRCVVERVASESQFNKCRALNLGARRAITEGAQYLCFLDSDTIVDVAFFDWLFEHVEPGRFLIAALDNHTYDVHGLTGLLAVSSADFSATDGFDESFQGWGSEDIEMRLRLHVLHGLAYSDIPLSLVRAITHGDSLRVSFYSEKNIQSSNQNNLTRLILKLHAWNKLGRSFDSRTGGRLFYKFNGRELQTRSGNLTPALDCPLDTTISS